MLKIRITLVLIFLCSISTFAQKSLNDYKYVIVPIKYEFQKSEYSYRINSLTKFLFEKEGFTVIMSDDSYPVDYSTNHCLALTAKLNNKSGILMTKLYYDLVDCNNNIIFSTNLAKTNEKDFERAYNIAIRKTFEDIIAQNYKYEPKETTAEVTTVAAVVTTPKVETTQTKVEPKVKNNNIPKKEAVVVVTPIAVKKVDTNVLYAQEITNGYQLVDSTPKVVYIALKTSVKDVYMIKGMNGTIQKINGIWVAEYYEGDALIQKELNIKLME
ncbi:MAG: hypothetical protein PSN34_08725 [Urechidicola sp.]|nr:hypothetical protein [Urechidicola sp.]